MPESDRPSSPNPRTPVLGTPPIAGPDHGIAPSLFDRVRCVVQSPNVIRFRCRVCNWGIECEYDERETVMVCPSCAARQYLPARFFAWNDRIRNTLARRAQKIPSAVLGEPPIEDWRHSKPLSMLDRMRRGIQPAQRVWSLCKSCRWPIRSAYTGPANAAEPRQCPVCGVWQYIASGAFAWNARVFRAETALREDEARRAAISQQRADTEQARLQAERERLETSRVKIAAEAAAAKEAAAMHAAEVRAQHLASLEQIESEKRARLAAESAQIQAGQFETAPSTSVDHPASAGSRVRSPVSIRANSKRSPSQRQPADTVALSWVLGIACIALGATAYYQYNRAETAEEQGRRALRSQTYESARLRAQSAMDDLARQPPGTWHSRYSTVYHNSPFCETGNNIELENRQPGTGGNTLCDRCRRLRTLGR
ncbi:hypothetical protein PHYC_00483 [Phycisphaerales bacterium]|nr:hypothetical protein PHYC_00483 [Phycisphaerales bacterium]